MMFRTKGRRLREDRERGLLFAWRGAESNLGSMLLALLIVGLLGSAVGALVRVKIGEPPLDGETRASLVMVPDDGSGRRLLRAAVEAGPYPLRWNPAADPEYAALRGRAMRLAAAGGLRYEPTLRSVGGEAVRSGESVEPESVLPPLPESGATIPPARRARVVARPIGGGEGLRLAELPLSAANAVAVDGRRFLVGFDVAGRVESVTPLDPEEAPVDLEGWLRRGTLADGAGGWRVVETRLLP